jgi:uncharacterized damage-inducible protein DinB
MNYYGAKELAASFRTVRGNTIQLAEDVPEDKYGFVPAEGTKSVAESLVHIALSYKFNYLVHAGEKKDTLEGIDFPALMETMGAEAAQPRNKAQIIDLLKTEGEVWAGFVEGLSDDFLAEPVGMPAGAEPSSKSRFEMMLSVKEHEMHHRGQLMVAERLIGVVPHLTRRMQEHLAEMQAAKANG